MGEKAIIIGLAVMALIAVLLHAALSKNRRSVLLETNTKPLDMGGQPTTPGWYDDPDGVHEHQAYWDGEGWTGETRQNAGSTSGLARAALWSPVVGLAFWLLIERVPDYVVGFGFFAGQLAGIILGIVTMGRSGPGGADRGAGGCAVALGIVLSGVAFWALALGAAMGAFG